MIDHTIQIAVLYTCKVAKSGYRFEGKRKLLTPIDPNTHFISKEFTRETINDFQSIIKIKSIAEDGISDDEARLAFCNRWGALQEPQENNASFISLRKMMSEYQQAREKGEYPSIGIDLGAKLVTNEYGKAIPAIECVNLYDALKASWFLSVQHGIETQICEYFREYGERKSCQRYFEKRPGKKFCSDNCNAAYYTKKSKEKNK